MMNIQNPTYEYLILIMLITCSLCIWLERKLVFFSHVSGVCMTILTAIFLNSIGVIPQKSFIYDFFMGPAVPVAIALMIFGIQLNDLLKLPKTLLLVFTVGVLSSTLGGVIAAVLFSKSLGENAPKLAAQLTASYIGGNENAVALHKMLGVPTELFAASFTVDAVMTSLWLIITIFIAGSDIKKNNTTHFNIDGRSFDGCPMTLVEIFISITLAIITAETSKILFNYFNWMHPLLIVSLLSFLISRHKTIQALIRPSYLIGTVLFVPFFFSTGAVANLEALASVSISVFFMPIVIVSIHGILIYTFAKVLKISKSETSLASQALIGGAGTAVALAQAKQWKNGISMGLILGLVGYAIANFLGIFVYHISKNIIAWLEI